MNLRECKHPDCSRYTEFGNAPGLCSLHGMLAKAPLLTPEDFDYFLELLRETKPYTEAERQQRAQETTLRGIREQAARTWRSRRHAFDSGVPTRLIRQAIARGFMDAATEAADAERAADEVDQAAAGQIAADQETASTLTEASVRASLRALLDPFRGENTDDTETPTP